VSEPEVVEPQDPSIDLKADGRGHFYAMLRLTREVCLSSSWQGSPEAALVLLVEKMRGQYELWASTPIRLLDDSDVRSQAWLGRLVGGKG
jgi:hypothetical protein